MSRDRYRGLVTSLRYHDYFLVCADFDDYYAKQRTIGDLWRRPDEWWQAAILNTANVGWFSSDRSIREYASGIWNVPTYTAAVTFGARPGLLVCSERTLIVREQQEPPRQETA